MEEKDKLRHEEGKQMIDKQTRDKKDEEKKGHTKTSGRKEGMKDWESRVPLQRLCVNLSWHGALESTLACASSSPSFPPFFSSFLSPLLHSTASSFSSTPLAPFPIYHTLFLVQFLPIYFILLPFLQLPFSFHPPYYIHIQTIQTRTYTL